MVDPARGLPHMQVHSYSEFITENGRVVMNDAGSRITPKGIKCDLKYKTIKQIAFVDYETWVYFKFF